MITCSAEGKIERQCKYEKVDENAEKVFKRPSFNGVATIVVVFEVVHSVTYLN